MNEITNIQVLIAVIGISLIVNITLACFLIRRRSQEIKRIVSFSFDVLLTVQERIEEITKHIKEQSEVWVRSELAGMRKHTAANIQGIDATLITDLNRINRISGCRSSREMASILSVANQMLLKYLEPGNAGPEMATKVLSELAKAIPLIHAAKETAISKVSL